jgi:hypothetical protein
MVLFGLVASNGERCQYVDRRTRLLVHESPRLDRASGIRAAV